MERQHKFKIEQVDNSIMQALQTSEATAYFAAMSFQLGCAIGELIGMGVTQAQLFAACNEFIHKAVETKLSVNTKESSH